ncbi:MAG: phosphate--acyl-ACP acyltransferase, partial [Oscillospiraceae bacterium]|nr:phosphate--acyl-ACP acyltransferase [Oscillospiraceae bacterium]
EGAALFFTGEIKKTFTKNLKTRIAGLLVKKGFTAFKNRFDYREAGGTAILGIAKPVIKAHGSSDARAIVSTVRQAIEFVRADVAGGIAANINDIKPDAAEL